jgi:Spy/CpxP family protein refolding chaperone
MRKTLIALLVVPALALAEGTPRDKTPAAPGPDPVRVEKRIRLMRTLGLASALDLDTEQALKLGDTMAKFDARRQAIREQARGARQALRAAAQGGKATAAEVDGAIAKLLDLRAQGQALDKEMLQAVTQGLTPQQKARATLFLGSFRHGMDRHLMRGGPGPGRGPGPGGMGGGRMGRGRGPGLGDRACDGTGPCAGPGRGAMMGPDDDHWAMQGRGGVPADDDAGEADDL